MWGLGLGLNSRKAAYCSCLLEGISGMAMGLRFQGGRDAGGRMGLCLISFTLPRPPLLPAPPCPTLPTSLPLSSVLSTPTLLFPAPPSLPFSKLQALLDPHPLPSFCSPSPTPSPTSTLPSSPVLILPLPPQTFPFGLRFLVALAGKSPSLGLGPGAVISVGTGFIETCHRHPCFVFWAHHGEEGELKQRRQEI